MNIRNILKVNRNNISSNLNGISKMYRLMMTNVEIGNETKNAKRNMLLHLRGLINLFEGSY